MGHEADNPLNCMKLMMMIIIIIIIIIINLWVYIMRYSLLQLQLPAILKPCFLQ
jgi:hypothetical protein